MTERDFTALTLPLVRVLGALGYLVARARLADEWWVQLDGVPYPMLYRREVIEAMNWRAQDMLDAALPRRPCA